jgi:hypothetical protein
MPQSGKKIYTTAILILIIIFSVISAIAEQAGGKWNGTYSYHEQLGKIGEMGMAVDYTIEKESDNSEMGAVIKAEGYQTDEEIRCDTRSQGNEIKILFNSYPDGGTMNRFGVEEYKKGDLLLSIQKVAGTKGTKYLGLWGKYNTSGKKKVYFSKDK